MAKSMTFINDSDIYQQALSERKKLRNYFQLNEKYPQPEEIDEVVVILASSRSGSSLLHHLLSQHPDIISLQGEEVTFTKMFGLNSITSFDDSDLLAKDILPDSKKISELAQEILSDAGYRDQTSERLALDRGLRLILQWPHLKFEQADLIAATSLPEWLDVIDYLKNKNYQIDLNCYDHLCNKKEYFMQYTQDGYHKSFIEEPPFIIPKSKTYKKENAKKILLLKSSINSFRAEFLGHLFPKAKFHFIHLTRNPAASINGLMDGWLSSWFHSHNLSHLTTLEIKNYENQHWWKFDLPPGWKEYTKSPLEIVCAFQWQSANQSILNFLEDQKSIHIKYENMTDLESMKISLNEICQKINLNNSFIQKLVPPPHIMSVNKPTAYRWKERIELLLPLINTPAIAQLSKKLGYDVSNVQELK
jgi:hypothetical protein